MWTGEDLYENGKLITFNEWQKRGATQNSFLVWRSIISVLPYHWKQKLKNKNYINMPIQAEIKVHEICKPFIKINSKDIKP